MSLLGDNRWQRVIYAETIFTAHKVAMSCYCLVEPSEEGIYFSVRARIFIFFLINSIFFMLKNVSDVSVT